MKNSVYNSADELVTRLNDASSAIDEVANAQNDRLNEQVDEVNALLEKIATLNGNIVRMEARQAGSSTVLKDDRQAALEELASMMDFSTTSQADGSVTVSLPSSGGVAGQTLVEGGTAGSIAVTVDATGNPSGLEATFNGVTSAFSPSEGSLSVLDPVNTNAVIADLRSQLDSLAGQLISSVNTAYNDSGLGDFFSGTGAADIALVITDASSITAASSTDPEGGNSVAAALSALSDQEFVDGTDQINGKFSEFSAGIATNVASELSSASDALDQQEQMETLVRTNRDNITGVSTEEEMTDLLRAQNAYQASARVVNVLNTLLELVTTRLGA